MLTPFRETPDPDTPGADLAWHWGRERWLDYAHALNPLLCLLLLPFVSGVSRPLTLLLAASLALGAVGQILLLRFTPRPGRLRAIRALATAIEWQAALGVIMLCAHDPDSEAPGLLLVLLILTAARYGLRGLAGATAGATLAVATLALTQVSTLEVLQPAEIPDVLRHWDWLIGGQAFTLALLLGPVELHRRDAPLPIGTAPPAPPPTRPTMRVPTPLSPREAAIFTLLEEGLTQKEIARQLHIAPSTVKTHVEHLALKLDAAGTSRRAILRAARSPDPLRPPAPPPPPPPAARE